MLVPLPPKSHRRRPPKLRKHFAPPAPVVNQILSVTRGESEDEVWVSVSGTVIGLDPLLALEVSDGVTAWQPIGGNYDNPSEVLFLFEGSITWALSWRVPDVASWAFADSQPLVAPLEGSIE